MSHRNRGRRASAAVLAGLIASTSIAARAQTAPSPTKAISPAAQISIGAADIGGVVASAHGPEAGVWVIAETTDLPTKFAKIVVTDDAGRYLIPDLPKANYKVWVRGYGLVDSPRVDVTLGQNLGLAATIAPSEAAAAKHYPGMYWYSMLRQFTLGDPKQATEFRPSWFVALCRLDGARECSRCRAEISEFAHARMAGLAGVFDRIDPSALGLQLAAIFGGSEGGPMAAFAPMVGKHLGVKKVPIKYSIDGKIRSVGETWVAAGHPVAHLAVEPLPSAHPSARQARIRRGRPGQLVCRSRHALGQFGQERPLCADQLVELTATPACDERDMTDWAAIDRLLLRDRWIVGGCVAAIAELSRRACASDPTPTNYLSFRYIEGRREWLSR